MGPLTLVNEFRVFRVLRFQVLAYQIECYMNLVHFIYLCDLGHHLLSNLIDLLFIDDIDDILVT